MSDVLFINMPFAALERPSLALGLFSSSLRSESISCRVLHPNLQYGHQIGLDCFTLMRMANPSSLVGEWIFSKSAFGSEAKDLSPRIRRGLASAPAPFVNQIVKANRCESLEELLTQLQQKATEFIDRLTQSIVAMNPRIVACTSMFDQHVASLALLRHVKEADPSIVTMIGGANCAAEMGSATHGAFPWIDYTITGEFDQHLVGFTQTLLSQGTRPIESTALPPNVLGPAHRRNEGLPEVGPVSLLHDMDAAATPDFDDYFEDLLSSPIQNYIVPSLVLESSRGCWWGAKHHCTFCGLNATGMVFRKKSAERVLNEIRSLTSRYRLYQWSTTDNIIDMSYFKSVLPELAKDEAQYRFFYETKANLTRKQVRTFADAGCLVVQPGIESLHDATLELMKKGTTAGMNIALLKYCLEFGVIPMWNILCGFPGSDPTWVLRTAEKFPALHHLPPPGNVAPIRFDRFSPYQQHAEKYNITLKPANNYRDVYPVSDEVFEDLVYFFDPLFEEDIVREVKQNTAAADAFAQDWRMAFYSPERPRLEIQDEQSDRMRILDTRNISEANIHEISGPEVAILRALERPVSLDGYVQRVLRGSPEQYTSSALESAMASLLKRQLVWQSDTQVVALHCRPPERDTLPSRLGVLGRVRISEYFKDKVRFQLQFGAHNAPSSPPTTK